MSYYSCILFTYNVIYMYLTYMIYLLFCAVGYPYFLRKGVALHLVTNVSTAMYVIIVCEVIHTFGGKLHACVVAWYNHNMYGCA